MSDDGWITVSHKKRKNKQKKEPPEDKNIIESIKFPYNIISGFYGKLAFNNLKNAPVWNRVDRCRQLIKRMDKEIEHYTNRFKRSGNHEVLTWIEEREDQKQVYMYYLNKISNY